MILVPRHLARPSCFDGTEEGRYREWRFQLVVYLAAVDPRFAEVADDVARRITPYLRTDLSPDEEGERVYLMLYSDHRGLHQEQTSAPDHGNRKP